MPVNHHQPKIPVIGYLGKNRHFFIRLHDKESLSCQGPWSTWYTACPWIRRSNLDLVKKFSSALNKELLHPKSDLFTTRFVMNSPREDPRWTITVLNSGLHRWITRRIGRQGLYEVCIKIRGTLASYEMINLPSLYLHIWLVFQKLEHVHP